MDEQITYRQENEIEAFDWGLYAALIRKRRKDMGYKTAKAFSYSIYRRTRIKVSEQTLYKIENGKQIPNATVFFALNLALFGTLIPKTELDMCLCSEWRGIHKSNGEIPQEWKYENYENYISAAKDAGVEYGDNLPNEREVAASLEDDPSLFSYVPF